MRSRISTLSICLFFAVVLLTSLVFVPARADPARVFVTSTYSNGDLGGLLGADGMCQARADAASLGGSWKAWICTDSEDAATRLEHNDDGYRLLSGTIVADNWVDLTDGSLNHAINRTELDTELFAGDVWTNCDTDGTIIHSDYDCTDWTSPTIPAGYIGNADRTDAWWTFRTQYGCGFTQGRLYCFEQAATAVDLSLFTASALPPAVSVHWKTETEIDTVGFRIWRSNTKDGNYKALNKRLVPAKGDAVQGACYEFVDSQCQGSCYYRMEEIDTHGVSTFYSPIEAVSSRAPSIYSQRVSQEIGSSIGMVLGASASPVAPATAAWHPGEAPRSLCRRQGTERSTRHPWRRTCAAPPSDREASVPLQSHEDGESLAARSWTATSGQSC